MSKAQCSTCFYWLRSSRQDWNAQGGAVTSTPMGWGDCRRFPPTGPRDDYGGHLNSWSRTLEDDWCGEHEETLP